MSKERRVYLAGSITKLERDEAAGWRRDLCHYFKEPWVCLDPTTLEAKDMTPRETVMLDYGWILHAKVVLADVRAPSWGTGMEIAFACMHRVPVIGWGKPSHLSPWLVHHVPVILPTYENAADYIVERF